MNIPNQVRYPKPLDKPDEKRETIPNLAPTEPPFAFGSGGRWALTLREDNDNQVFCFGRNWTNA